MAKKCNVSVQTLRYYDKIGIFCPDRIDNSTGYRYYSAEKVKEYDTIQHLKGLNFSLEEIKEFICNPEHKKLIMYSKKKRELLENLVSSNEKISLIDEACTNNKRDVFSLSQKIHSIPFEDDPVAIGEWEYIGDLPPCVEFNGENSLEKVDGCRFDKLYFLPGGQKVWTYFWTKGILYFTVSDINIIVPNEYTVFAHGKDVYMRLKYDLENTIEPSIAPSVRIYKRVSDRAMSLRDTYQHIDKVDVPHVPDKDAVGIWETISCIRTPDDFTTVPNNTQRPFYIQGIEFFERGVCNKYICTGGVQYTQPFFYTKEYVLCMRERFAEKYTIVRVNGRDYMILEYKNGDYAYLGRVSCYYVFRRIGK